MPEVPVNGRVLQWAREIRGLTVEKAAERLGISQAELLAYESGMKKPLVTFLRQMSSKYQINFTSLLMPEPLPPPERPMDYRARFGDRPLSIETLVAIEEITEALDVFEDIATVSRGILPKLNIGEAELADDPEAVAANERRRFAVGIEEQREWKTLDNARRRWRERIERRGIFTYMIPMGSHEELSGFSRLRDGLAAICVNDREPTEGAKIFTFFHEYCHLLLRQTGISDENDQHTVEIFCNQFAASFLIPKTALLEATEGFERPYNFSSAEVQHLARRFLVSNRAMALRLEKTGLAPAGFYGRRTAPWDFPRAPVTPKARQQPSAIKIRIKRLGHLHTSALLRAVKRGVINSFDASQLIGLQPAYFKKVEHELSGSVRKSGSRPTQKC